GRVDRHGSGPPVSNTVLRSKQANGYLRWWLDALTVFGVFEQTTAPLQYAIETVESELYFRLLTDGLDDAFVLLPGLEGRVAEEQARIDRVDTLDALAHPETDDVELVKAALTGEQDVGDSFSESVRGVLNVYKSELDSETSSTRKNLTTDTVV